MINFSIKTNQVPQLAIQRYFFISGLVMACAVLLAALLFLLWLVQEVLQAVAEVVHLISITNPIIITGVLVVLAVWLLGKVKR